MKKNEVSQFRKKLKGGPFGFFNIHSAVKLQKKMKAEPLRLKSRTMSK